MELKIGKVPIKILNEVIFNKKSAISRKEVVVKPSVGEDCTALSISDKLCILSSDPITGTAKDIGYLAVHINVNDIASAGGEAIGIMLTVLLPQGSTVSDLSDIMEGALKAAKEANIEIIGGHTEVTDAVNRPIVSATIVGMGERFVYTSGAKVSDDIIITKYGALEGTAILAKYYEKELTGLLGKEFTERAVSLSSHLSVVKEAEIAKSFNVNCMHDVTEGGVLGAVYEITQAAGVGAEIDLDKVPILPETKEICKMLKIDIYKLISSGCLLITAKNGTKVVDALKAKGVNAAIIGKIVESERKYFKDGKQYELEEVCSDELYKVT